MRRNISSRVLYLDRSEWGADLAGLPRLGGPEDPRRAGGWPLVPRAGRVYNIKHHTVAVDNDVTKNIWETKDEVIAWMQRLQQIRPDLGLDVPYNFVKFLMEGGRLIVCEGRGYDRAGAHTAGRDVDGRYFNVAGIATAYHANFEDFTVDFDIWMPAINDWNRHLREEFPNIGTATVCGRPGRATCGHRDFSRFSDLNATACPGQHLYAVLPRISFEGEGEIDMATAEELRNELRAEFTRQSDDTRRFFAMVCNGLGKDLRDVKAATEFLSAIAVNHEARLRQAGTIDNSTGGEVQAAVEAVRTRMAAIEGRLQAAAAELAAAGAAPGE